MPSTRCTAKQHKHPSSDKSVDNDEWQSTASIYLQVDVYGHVLHRLPHEAESSMENTTCLDEKMPTARMMMYRLWCMESTLLYPAEMLRPHLGETTSLPWGSHPLPRGGQRNERVEEEGYVCPGLLCGGDGRLSSDQFGEMQSSLAGSKRSVGDHKR